MSNQLAVLFAGQGSQYPKMGLDLMEAFPEFKKKAQQLQSILNYDPYLFLQTEDDLIHQTQYAQSLILLHSMMLYECAKKQGVLASYIAGFSLGEYSAYYAAGVYDFKNAIEIIHKRASLMQAAVQGLNTGMAAVLGGSEEVVLKLCKTVSEPNDWVVIANYNAPGQIVISGHLTAINRFTDAAKTNGVKRVIPLQVSGAFHSPILKEAGKQLKDFAKQFQLEKPKVPLYLNTTARPLTDECMTDQMEKQMQEPVLFEQTLKNMIKDGATHFIDIGPGQILTGLVKKVDPDAVVFNLEKLADLDHLKGWLKTYGFTT